MRVFPEWKRWKGETVFCVASGPSLTAEDVAALRGRGRIITVNTSWRLAPWADVHYSSDHDWWELNIDRMRRECQGEFWTGHPDYMEPDVRRCRFDKRARGLSVTPGVISWGGNSGYCAVGLAWQFGASRIVLLGYDMSDRSGPHWHGEHPQSVRKPFAFDMWARRFVELARDFQMLGIPVLNASRETALSCFPRISLEEALCCNF